MRTFIGLDLTPSAKQTIAEWREKSFPKYPKAVPAENFHVTLAFLGNIAEGSLEQISQMELKMGEISLNANFPGFFSKPGIGFLGIEISESLEVLKDDIYRQLPKGIKASRQHKFVPHITLFRGLKHPMSAPLIEPNFILTFDQVHLFESLQHNNRVTYRSVIRWK